MYLPDVERYKIRTVNSETIGTTDVCRKFLSFLQFQNGLNKYKLLLGYKNKMFLFFFILLHSYIVNYF